MVVVKLWLFVIRRTTLLTTSNVVVGETDDEFSFNFKVENIKILPGTYDVVVSQKLLDLHPRIDLTSKPDSTMIDDRYLPYSRAVLLRTFDSTVCFWSDLLVNFSSLLLRLGMWL